MHLLHLVLFFFFNDTATTEIYTLSLHDALPISGRAARRPWSRCSHRTRWPSPRRPSSRCGSRRWTPAPGAARSEEHTSELQSRSDLVCRLLLEKKKQTTSSYHTPLRCAETSFSH